MAKVPVIRITSKRDGFRRCGIEHPATAVDHPVDQFTKEQLKALKAEPMLVVSEEEITVEDEKKKG